LWSKSIKGKGEKDGGVEVLGDGVGWGCKMENCRQLDKVLAITDHNKIHHATLEASNDRYKKSYLLQHVL